MPNEANGLASLLEALAGEEPGRPQSKEHLPMFAQAILLTEIKEMLEEKREPFKFGDIIVPRPHMTGIKDKYRNSTLLFFVRYLGDLDAHGAHDLSLLVDRKLAELTINGRTSSYCCHFDCVLGHLNHEGIMIYDIDDSQNYKLSNHDFTQGKAQG